MTIVLMVTGLTLTGCGGNENGGSNNEFQQVEVPNIRAFCEGITPVDMSSPDVTISGGDCNETAIRAAVEAGGRVLIDCPAGEVVFTSQMLVTQDTVIDGNGVTVLSGGSTTRLIQKQPGPDLAIQNIELRNGLAPQDIGTVNQANWFNWTGALINVLGHNEGGTFRAYNVQFNDGVSAPHVYSDGFRDTGSGGALYLFWVTDARIDRCTFNGNEGVTGGALGSLGSKLTVSNSVFSNNRAILKGDPANSNQGNGGAIYVDGSEQNNEDNDNRVVLCSNQFVNNNAVDAGGAVSLFTRGAKDTDVIVNRNSFVDNSADGQGGGFYYFRAPNDDLPQYMDEGPDTFFLTQNLFQGNSAFQVGGGASLYNLYPSLGQGFAGEISNNTFYDNVVTYDGGGVNDGGWGGALFGQGIYVDLIHNTFAENSSNNLEAGVLLGSSGGENGAALLNNLFYNNIAANANGAGVPGAFHVGGSLNQYVGDFNPALHQGNLYFPDASDTPGAAVIADPLLEALADNGGATETLALGAGSPAINAGVVLPSLPTVDQRDFPRDDGSPDIGAFEVE